MLWYKIGCRNNIESNDEIGCNGCKKENRCRYEIISCTSSKNLHNCGECEEYPCIKINAAFEKTKEFEQKCRKVCTIDEYNTMLKASFENKKNLDEISMLKDISQAEPKDLDDLLLLYTQLHDNPLPEKSIQLIELWQNIMNDPNHHIVVCRKDGRIVSSCVIVVIRNLTHGQHPYALIENVITDEQYRKKGIASACLNYAKKIAQKENCYKIMLMTGSKQESTLHFYEKAGYNRYDKTAFIQWL
jgi:ribosomal protein S18 acetylase RimI-like enzyme